MIPISDQGFKRKTVNTMSNPNVISEHDHSSEKSFTISETARRVHLKLKDTISSKKWYGFDLDDTLHEFRKASATASLSVFEEIYGEFGVSVNDLKASYNDILRSKTAGAFTDGRTSTEYRRERFSTLLQAHGLDPDEAKLNHLLEIYQSNLQAALTLKPGALQLLRKLKNQGKKVIVVTEGPQDAQEWTVRQLGLQPYTDVLITTNEIGKSKVDGLFSVVLHKYGIPKEDIVYIGDNKTRDILPAQGVGIFAVLLDEKSDCQFDDPSDFRINSLETLKCLIE